MNCKKLIKKGICKADCCGIVPFESDFIYKNFNKKVNKEHEQVHIGGGLFILITDDLKCVFLKNNKCNVYQDRPEVCRKFGDGSHPLLTCPHIGE